MAIKTVKIPGMQPIVIDEWLHWPQYSSVEWAAASALDLQAFSYVVSQNVPSVGLARRQATDADTNMAARARQNHDEAFIAYGWTYEVFGLSSDRIGTAGAFIGVAPWLTSTNHKRLHRDILFELKIGAGIDKPMARAPMEYVGESIGSPAWASGDAVDGTTRLDYGTAGAISPRQVRRWNLPINIESDRKMTLRVRSLGGAVAGLTQNVRLRIWLDGLKRRPIA